MSKSKKNMRLHQPPQQQPQPQQHGKKKEVKLSKPELDKLAGFNKNIDAATRQLGMLYLDFKRNESMILTQLGDQRRKLNDYLNELKKAHNINNIKSVDFKRGRIIE